MEDKALTLRQELPRLIEAAKALEASMLLMLLVNVDEELRRQKPECPKEPEHDLADRL